MKCSSCGGDCIPISKIDSLIEDIQITTLIPTQQLDITQTTDMIRDFFIRSLEDLKNEN